MYISYKRGGRTRDITSRTSGWAPLVYALACSCHHLLGHFTPLLQLRLQLAFLNGRELIICCTNSLERQGRNALCNHRVQSRCINLLDVAIAEYFNVICRITYIRFLSKT